MRLSWVSFERGRARGRKSLKGTKGCMCGGGGVRPVLIPCCLLLGWDLALAPFLKTDFSFFFSFVDLDRKGRAIFSFSPNIIQEGSRALGDMWLCSEGHLQKDGLGKKCLLWNTETCPERVISVRTDSISPTALGWGTNLIRQRILLLGRSPAKPTSCKNKYSSANILIS